MCRVKNLHLGELGCKQFIKINRKVDKNISIFIKGVILKNI